MMECKIYPECKDYSKHFCESGKGQKYSILKWVSETQSSK